MRNVRRVPVKLASGEKEAHLSHGTVLFKEEVEPLASVGRVVRLDCKVRWDSDAFVLEHPQRGVLPVMVERDVPVIAKSLALELTNELEEREREENQPPQSLEPPRLYSSQVKKEEPAESEAEPGVPQDTAPPPAPDTAVEPSQEEETAKKEEEEEGSSSEKGQADYERDSPEEPKKE